jgi:hypothetical protein
MKKWILMLLIFFASILVIISLSPFGPYLLGAYNGEIFKANLDKEIQLYDKGEVNDVDFSKLGNVPWDRVYVFAPYTTVEQINSTIGIKWIGSNLTAIPSSDSINLMIFMSGQRVVQHLEFPAYNADFWRADNRLGYPFNEAKFARNAIGDFVWVDN